MSKESAIEPRLLAQAFESHCLKMRVVQKLLILMSKDNSKIE